MPLVSVIIPAFNSADTIRAALESVGKWKLETGNSKLETEDGKLETGNWKVETGDGRLETGNGKRETGNSKLETEDGNSATRQPDNLATQFTCEIIVVDDASTDGTAEEVRNWQGAWRMAHGAESREQRAERMAHGAESGEQRASSFAKATADEKGKEQGAERKEHGAWSMAHGVRCHAQNEDGKENSSSGSMLSAPCAMLLTLPRNSGPAAARNRGIAEAKGEWIAFLDADDTWLPGKLAIQLRAAEEHPDVALWCGGVVAGGDDAWRREHGAWRMARSAPQVAQSAEGKEQSAEGKEQRAKDRGHGAHGAKRATSAAKRATSAAKCATSGEEKQSAERRAHGEANNQAVGSSAAMRHAPCAMPPPAAMPHLWRAARHAPLVARCAPCALREIRLADFASGNPVATSTVLVKRTALAAVGGFDEQFRGPEDYDLWMRIAARFEIGKIDAPLMRYRQRSGSLSMDDRKFLPQVLRVLDKAFAEDGALSTHRGLRSAALSSQYWSASWMAFCRGDRRTAVRHWFRGYRLDRQSSEKARRPWFRMLTRYLMGTRGGGE